MKNHHSVLLKSAINISEDAKVTLMPLILYKNPPNFWSSARTPFFDTSK